MKSKCSFPNACEGELNLDIGPDWCMRLNDDYDEIRMSISTIKVSFFPTVSFSLLDRHGHFLSISRVYDPQCTCPFQMLLLISCRFIDIMVADFGNIHMIIVQNNTQHRFLKYFRLDQATRMQFCRQCNSGSLVSTTPSNTWETRKFKDIQHTHP